MRKSFQPSSAPTFLQKLMFVFSKNARECARVERLISLLADGMASDAEKLEIDAHCSNCANCRTLQATLLVARAELRSRPVVVLPDGLADRLQNAMRQERLREQADQRRRAIFTGPKLRLGLGGAVAAIVVAAVVLTHDGLHNQTIITPAHVSPHTTIAELPAPAAPLISKKSPTQHRDIVASLPHATPDQYLPTAIREPDLSVSKVERNTSAQTQSSSTGIAVSTGVKPERHLSVPVTVTSPKSEHPMLVAKGPYSHQSQVPDTSSPVLTTPQPTHSDQPTIVATLPSNQSTSDSSAVVTTASDDNHGSHLNGMLRSLVLRAQTQQVADAKISLASMVLRPTYNETVPMVSAPVR